MLLEARDLWKSFGGRPALRGVELSIKDKGIVSLLGPNGAGKSTFMKIAAGILRPERGSILVMGRDPRDPEARSLIAYCPQEPGLFDELNSWDNLMFYARLYSLPEQKAREKARILLEELGILDHASKPVGKLSGGMRKKLGLAIAMLAEPPLYLLDEPTTGMDPGSRRDVWRILREIKADGGAVLLATHYMDEADELSDTVYIMDKGRIVASGKPEKLKERYGPPSVVEIMFRRVPSQSSVEDALRGLEHTWSEGKLRVSVERPEKVVPRLVEQLYSLGADIGSVRIVKPTLEDVFLKLTGRRLETSEEK